MKPATTRRLRLSLVQLMTLVVYCAVGSACVAPMVRLWQNGVVNGGTLQGLVSVALFASVLVPLVWVALSLLVVRRGAWRDGLICALLLCSVSVSLGVASWWFFSYTYPVHGNPFKRLLIVALALHLFVILSLIASILWLTVRLWRCLRAGKTSDGLDRSARTTTASPPAEANEAHRSGKPQT
jgi:hypothetical protein